jgi:Helicase associated domain
MVKIEGRRHSNLTQGRENLLTKLGFVWNAHNATWDSFYDELVEFQQRHGHCHIPTRYPENPPLAAWVKLQRRRLKETCLHQLSALSLPSSSSANISSTTRTTTSSSSTGSLLMLSATELIHQERRDRLLGLGFDWDPRNKCKT